jgi:glycosyltransferase involved in cell wall biosynthesis
VDISSSPTFEIVVPTKDRLDRLERCLEAIGRARGELDLPVLVADSSNDRNHAETVNLVGRYPFARVERHSGANVSMARNFCVQVATRDVLISVDDDTQVEPDALEELISAYLGSPKPCVVAGATAWDGEYCEPVVMRHIGYGRPAREGEQPTFLITALLAFPRALAIALPWNERLSSDDDIYIGCLWRGRGVNLCFAPAARSIHDPIHSYYGAGMEDSVIYTNLFDAIFANPDWKRAVSYEILGFAAAAKLHLRTVTGARRFLTSWVRGNRDLFRDRSYLRNVVGRELPESLLGTES